MFYTFYFFYLLTQWNNHRKSWHLTSLLTLNAPQSSAALLSHITQYHNKQTPHGLPPPSSFQKHRNERQKNGNEHQLLILALFYLWDWHINKNKNINISRNNVNPDRPRIQNKTRLEMVCVVVLCQRKEKRMNTLCDGAFYYVFKLISFRFVPIQERIEVNILLKIYIRLFWFFLQKIFHILFIYFFAKAL